MGGGQSQDEVKAVVSSTTMSTQADPHLVVAQCHSIVQCIVFSVKGAPIFISFMCCKAVMSAALFAQHLCIAGNTLPWNRATSLASSEGFFVAEGPSMDTGAMLICYDPDERSHEH